MCKQQQYSYQFIFEDQLTDRIGSLIVFTIKAKNPLEAVKMAFQREGVQDLPDRKGIVMTMGMLGKVEKKG